MEGRKDGRPLKSGRLLVGKTKQRVVLRLSEPMSEVHLTADEVESLVRSLGEMRRAISPMIFLLGDLGPAPPIGARGPRGVLTFKDGRRE